jgi:AraC-type DNA-binding domain-containing proteins
MNGIKVEYEEFNENIKITRHFHNSYEIIYVIEGCVIFVINTKKYEVKPGNIVFISHLESHEMFVTTCPYKRYLILIEPNILHTLLPDSRLTSVLKNRPQGFDHMMNLGTGNEQKIKSIFDEMLLEYGNSPVFADIGISALLQLLFITLYRSHEESFPVKSLTGPTGIVNDVQRYIDDNFTDPLSLKDISRQFYLDIFYLSHLFKKVCGYSMKDYLILQRISKAKDLLVHSDSSVADICIKSGFGNVNHFIRLFKMKEGVTPLQYRKNNK